MEPNGRSRLGRLARRPGSVPGGLTTRELQLILFGLADLGVIGADVVEVAPAYDHAQITALAAAGLTFDLLAMMARPSAPWVG